MIGHDGRVVGVVRKHNLTPGKLKRVSREKKKKKK
jgi:hypothetical protein